MQDELTWKLSLLVDDELPPNEAIVLLEQINQDPELRFKWYQYQTIRQAMRNGEGIFPQAEFLERIQIALEAESLPQNTPVAQPSGHPNKFNFNVWLAIPVALAAAILVVVLLKNRPELQPHPSGPVPMMAVAGNAQPTTVRVSPPQAEAFSSQDPRRSVPVRKSSRHVDASLLEDFLLVHSEDSLYQKGPQHMLSYARIISHGNH